MNYDASTYDVVIVGAGIAGCAVAMHIKINAPHFNILMIEHHQKEVDQSVLRIGETIPPQTGTILKRLGLWDQFKVQSLVCSYGTSASWGSTDLYTNPYMFSANGYGWHIDRTAFDQMMIESCIREGVNVSFDSRIVACHHVDRIWHIEYSKKGKDESIQSKFLIDASGKQSVVAKMLGIEKLKYDQLIGLYRYYSVPSESSKYGMGSVVEACAHGWWYSAALPNNKMVVSFMTDADIAHTLQMKKGGGYDRLLDQSTYTSQRIKDCTPVADLKAVASHTHILKSITADGWLAVGDAASSYDPISALGIYKSLAMSQYAAYAAMDYINDNLMGLIKYEKIVRADYKAYEFKRDEYYGMEKRYTTDIFWNRRQQHFSQKN